jgi:hypothetical protein
MFAGAFYDGRLDLWDPAGSNWKTSRKNVELELVTGHGVGGCNVLSLLLFLSDLTFIVAERKHEGMHTVYRINSSSYCTASGPVYSGHTF